MIKLFLRYNLALKETVNCISKQIFLLLIVLSCCSSAAIAQKERKSRDTTKLSAVEKFGRYFEFREGKKWVYIPVPTAGYSPETGLLFGMAHQVLYQGKKDTLSTASSLNIAGFYTLNKQFYILGDWTGYFSNDDLILNNSVEYKYFPLNYFGIGNKSTEAVIAVYSGKSFKFISRANFRINEVLWLGPEFNINTYLTNNFSDVSNASELNLIGSNGFRNIGVGGLLRYDTRDNKLYSKRGMYFGFNGLLYPKFLGSTSSNYSLGFDYRYFTSSKNEKQTIGFQVKLDNRFGDIPFQTLASVGSSKTMRGYYSGRYRDAHSIDFQTEYRFPIIEKIRLRGAAFVSIGDVYNKLSDIELLNLKASIGVGLRYILDANSKTSIRFDYARTRDGNNGFYIEILEAF